MTMPLPKFRDHQIVKTVPEWPEEVIGIVYRVGERYGKDKKGNPVFETYSYLVRDGAGRVYYFLEAELK